MELSSSLSPDRFCSLKGSSLLGGKGVFPGMTIFNPLHSVYWAFAHLAWHSLAYNFSPSGEQTGRKTWVHFLTSHRSHDPFVGVWPSLAAQTASQRL